MGSPVTSDTNNNNNNNNNSNNYSKSVTGSDNDTFKSIVNDNNDTRLKTLSTQLMNKSEIADQNINLVNQNPIQLKKSDEIRQNIETEDNNNSKNNNDDDENNNHKNNYKHNDKNNDKNNDMHINNLKVSVNQNQNQNQNLDRDLTNNNVSHTHLNYNDNNKINDNDDSNNIYNNILVEDDDGDNDDDDEYESDSQFDEDQESTASTPSATKSFSPNNEPQMISIQQTSSTDLPKRRMIACKRCHSLKVKCVPIDPNVEFGSCKRCFKKKMACEYKIATKRKKSVPLTKSMKLKLKNDEIKKLRDELMKKDKLIKLLRGFTDDEEEQMSIDLTPQERLKVYCQEIKELENISKEPTTLLSSTQLTPQALSTNSSQFICNSERRVQISEAQLPSLDIIGNNLLSYSECSRLLNIFVTKIHARFPFVDLPKNLSLDYLNKNEPLLLIIMIYIATVADIEPSTVSVESQLQLECLIAKSISLEILLIGNKNFQLLKNTLLYSFWYIPPELFHHRRYHMFASLCVSMAHDLGINGRPYFFYNKGDGSVRKTSITHDDKNLELKALVLVVYTLYMSISLFLKRIIFLQWSDFLEESCIILENSNLRSHKLIVMYARINHLMELIHNNIHKTSEQMTVIELSTNKNKLQIAAYLNDLNNLKQKISNNFSESLSDYNSLMAYIYSVQAYLYEPAIQTLIKSKENITKEYKNVFFSTLSQICDSCLLSLKHFSELTIDEMTVNPLFHTSRILYTSGMLLRIRYLSLTIPKNRKASIFTEECISTIKILTDKIDETAKIYPKNHFIKKIRIVLGLFVHTCLSQWYVSYKNLFNEIKKHAPLFVDPMLSNKNNNNSVTLSANNNLNDLKRRKLNNNSFKPWMNGSNTDVNPQSIGMTGMLPSINSDSLGNRYNTIARPLNAMESRTPSYSIAQSPPTPILQIDGSTTSSNADENNIGTNSANDNYSPIVRFLPSLGNGNINNVLLRKDSSGQFTTRFPLQNNISLLQNFNPAPINTPGNINQLNTTEVTNSTNSAQMVAPNIPNIPGVRPLNNNPKNSNLPLNPNGMGTNNNTDNWEFQYMAFNDEFWSDLFFGDGEGNMIGSNTGSNRGSLSASMFNPVEMGYNIDAATNNINNNNHNNNHNLNNSNNSM
jgi:hypothetical protein